MEAAVTRVKSATRHEIIRFVYKSLQTYGWATTFNYLTRNPRIFFEVPLLISKGDQSEFRKYVDYCYLLSNNFTEKDEAARYKDRYGNSIYFSVLLYWLLVNFGVLNEKRLSYCQGYFKYTIQEDVCSRQRHRAGMHAWLCYNGSVIDTTIWEQKKLFCFEKYGFETPLIIGKIPEGLQLLGFEEEKSLAKEYARQFAKDSGQNFYEWINTHKQNAELLHNVLSMEKEANKKN